MQKKSALESWLGRVGWRWPDGHERLRSGQEGLSGCPQGWGWLRGARARPSNCLAAGGGGEEEVPRVPGGQVESNAISQDQRAVFMKPKDTESVDCPVGGLRGGQAGSLLMEADWGVREGA